MSEEPHIISTRRFFSGTFLGSFRAIRCVTVFAGLLVLRGSALGQDQMTGRPNDEIFARKIIMDTIDRHMDEIDWLLSSSQPIDLGKTFGHADTISVMLMAFPYLFPPDTNQWQAEAKRDPAHDTFASPDLWKNLSDFRRQAATASQLAFAASRAKRETDFRKTMATLRTACDACHALYVKSGE
ncbi:MAG TPA: cytochrome c [Xanthobacteraceae bacterium]|nr:cytochrome c [Xanthobacteraceae bacterium]